MTRNSKKRVNNAPEDQHRSVAAHVRDRQRAVAEREAARLARPERQEKKTLAHADLKKSGVSSTPFGFYRNTVVKYETEGEEWCGPFNVARQMIAKREEAKRLRDKELAQSNVISHPLDQLMEEHSMETRRRLHPSLSWKAKALPISKSSACAKRQKRINTRKSPVPSLFQICLDFLVSNIDCIEKLGDVGNDIRLAISKELVSFGKFDAQSFGVIVEPTMETLEIIDCSCLQQETLARAILEMKDLRILLLTHAGRAFGERCVESLLQSKTQLNCLSISGAYLLKDEDARQIISSNSSLQSVTFDTCPLLGARTIEALARSSTLLELTLQEMSLPTSALVQLSRSSNALANIKSLTLRSLTGLNDDILLGFLKTVCGSLESLDVSYNNEISDGFLAGLREFNGRLQSLSMNSVRGITSAGLEAFFTHPLDGLPAPPKVKLLDLGSCHHEAVTDKLLRLVTASISSSTATSPPARGSSFGGLVQLNVQGSSLVTDMMLERLAETSSTTLTTLNVSYCPLISDKGLGYLVSRTGQQLSSIQVWGCAQLTDIFFDGHTRIEDESLEISGAWMKKGGGGSSR